MTDQSPYRFTAADIGRRFRLTSQWDGGPVLLDPATLLEVTPNGYLIFEASPPYRHVASGEDVPGSTPLVALTADLILAAERLPD